jgi:hypothetical protein
MGRTLAVTLAFCLILVALPLVAQDEAQYEPLSSDQLDNLLAPIALYPDPLLAQVLVAATFPDQTDEAARFVRSDANADDLDGQPWDVSVKAVAHYPSVLEMMADKLDWTTTLGQAYVEQSTDVMASVQRLRAQARAEGNLVTTPEMQVVDSGGEIELWPAQPQYLYVPDYDPAVVFFYRSPLFFRTRFFIGAWLNIDFDWRLHRVFYHGWEHDGGWMERSRPFVHLTNVYVDNRYRDVIINRRVVDRPVDYRELNRYNDIHRKTDFDRFRGFSRTTTYAPHDSREVVHNDVIHNKVIVRNFNTNDPRLNEFRGHVPQPPSVVHAPETPAFTPVHGGFDPRVTSQRGQVSRALVKPPPPPPPPPHPPVHQVERKHP